MAKQVIILSNTAGPGDARNIVYLFWLAVATANAVKIPAFVSAYPNATAVETQSIQAGLTIEEAYTAQWPNAATITTIKSDLQAKFTARQSVITGLVNPNVWFGSNWDGTTWTDQALSVVRTKAGIDAPFNLSLSVGDNTIITGVAGQIITIEKFVISLSAQTILTFKSGASTSLLGPLYFTANSTLIFDYDPARQWMNTNAGDNFVINVSATTTAGGKAWYSQS